jgi:hypothetical protein
MVSGKMVCSKWWEFGAIDSCHVSGGNLPENHFIPDTPRPPIVKRRPVGGGGGGGGGSEKFHHPSIGVPAAGP